MSQAIGMDLGTTYSAVAAMRGGGPEILENQDGDRLTPSAVVFEEGEALVGQQAKNLAAVLPDEYVEFVKRQMGEARPAHIGADGKEYRPEEISAIILKRMATDAGKALGQEIRDVVVTVPAYFDDARRTATRDAGEIAGLNVIRLINEPTAAGIAYGLSTHDSGTFLVYDLGGGTFDVTVMRARGGDFDIIATGGDRNLGGFDFDNKLMEHVAGEIKGQGGPDLFDAGKAEAELRAACEAAKRTLTTAAKATIRLTPDGRTHKTQVTRERFESLTSALLSRTEITVEEVMEEAGVTWDQIDRILLVGGSTRMPMVSGMIQRMAGRMPDIGINPDEAVALGAAIYADNIAAQQSGARPAAPVRVGDVTSQTLGSTALDENEVRRNFPIIPKNSKIPCKGEEFFGTVVDNQERVQFDVTEGDDEDLEYVTVLSEKLLDLPPGLPANTGLKAVVAYDVDGRVHAELFLDGDNRSLGVIELDRPNNLGADAVSEMRQAMQELEIL